MEENRRRGKLDAEFELLDTGVFAENRYFDVVVEYAKSDPDDILIRIQAQSWTRRGPAEPDADNLVPQHMVVGARRRPPGAEKGVLLARFGSS